MTDTLDDLDDWIKEAIDSLSASQRARAARRIGGAVRKANAKRISGQVGPDGTKWAGRADGTRGKMMKGLRLSRNLKAKSTSDGVSIGWSGGAGRIARVHHLGLRDRVGKRGVRVKYQARELIGLSRDDQDMVETIVEDMLDGAGGLR